MPESPVPYPVFLDLWEKTCVVVGGGPVGERKVRGLLGAGARVVLIAPAAIDGLADLAESGRIAWVRRGYRSGDLEGSCLAFAATDSPQVNRAVQAEAQKRGIFLNVADGSAPGNFTVPSVLRRGPLGVAVSSGGASPAYSRLVRERLEAFLGPEHGAFLAYLAALRPKVRERFPHSPDRRAAVWQRLVRWETLELVRQDRWDQIEEMVSECLSSS